VFSSQKESEMAQSVFKTFRLRFKEPWFMLSKAEQDALLGKVGEVLTKVGYRSSGGTGAWKNIPALKQCRNTPGC
jgi:hypothetical protein